jgi:hypothetical protein
MSHFTLKRIIDDGGVSRETIYPVEAKVEVMFPATRDGHFPPGVKHFDYEVTGAALFIDAGPNGAGVMFTAGRFYVMNEAGHTVGSYDLGNDKVAGNGVAR